MKGKWLPEEGTVRKANLKKNAKQNTEFCVQEEQKAKNIRQVYAVQHTGFIVYPKKKKSKISKSGLFFDTFI